MTKGRKTTQQERAEIISFCIDEAHLLFHSDRGFQYTNKIFHAKLEEANMRQSMSRVGHCIDNESMVEFWGYIEVCTKIFLFFTLST